jgi:hypothetical protein
MALVAGRRYGSVVNRGRQKEKIMARRRIGAFDWTTLILPGGILIGGYIILNKLGLFSGSSANANSSSITASTTASVANSLAAAKASGDVQTLTQAQASGLATNIYNAGVADPVDMDMIQNSIISANSLTDLLLIIQAFGTKAAGGALCSLFGGVASSECSTYDLSGWVNATCDQSHINSINNYLANQGINYQF